ncbi:MAG: mannitol dehydrogenase family protein [Spirochaetes bacterium]|nr:mannitol dehydrogenase family protein [Spirochaetota bacterium]
MKLNYSELIKSEKWENAGIELPIYDIEKIKSETEKNPGWIHFGAGNIFRGYIARLQDTLLNNKNADRGIIAVESFDFEVIEKIYNKTDNLALNVLMGSDGKFNLRVVASIIKGMTTRRENGDFDQLVTYSCNPGLQMISFTITEKGYALKSHDDNFFPAVKSDLEKGPENPSHIMSVITSLVFSRYKKGAFPVALVSMDNCSNNGDRLKEAVLSIAGEWNKRKFVDDGFLEYLKNETAVSFPLSMIDKITPRPADSVKNYLAEKGLEDMDTVITSCNTYMAPFVNAEITEYLVIEDKFPNGRPLLEEAGVLFTDRNKVKDIETMKVTTCLNPLHTALAVTGCLLGYTSISEEMKDSDLKRLVHKIGYDEGLPVVVDPGIINPKKFIDEVVNERFPNPFIPDTPQRIASDTSQKVKIRFGETIKSYVENENLNPETLTGIQFAIAAWCRYLMGVDDEGNLFQISPDPMAEYLTSIMSSVSLGDKSADISVILSNSEIFGMDLYAAGIGKKIESIFTEMIQSKGAVRAALKKYV